MGVKYFCDFCNDEIIKGVVVGFEETVVLDNKKIDIEVGFCVTDDAYLCKDCQIRALELLDHRPKAINTP